MWGGVFEDAGPVTPPQPSHQEALERAKERIEKIRRDRQRANQFTVEINDPLDVAERKASGRSVSVKHSNTGGPSVVTSDFYQGKAPPAALFSPIPPSSVLGESIPEKYGRRTGLLLRPNSPVSRSSSPVNSKPWRNLSRPNLSGQSQDELVANGSVQSTGLAGQSPVLMSQLQLGLPNIASVSLSDINSSTLPAEAENFRQSELNTRKLKSVGNLSYYQRRNVNSSVNSNSVAFGNNSAYQLAASMRNLSSFGAGPSKPFLSMAALSPPPMSPKLSSIPRQEGVRDVDVDTRLDTSVSDKLLALESRQNELQLLHLKKWTDLRASFFDLVKQQYIDPLKFALQESSFWSKRRPEFEGLYVGQYPYVSPMNLLKFESRVRLENTNSGAASKWLNSDNQVIRQADHLSTKGRGLQLYITGGNTVFLLEFGKFTGTNPIPAVDHTFANPLMLLKPIKWDGFASKAASGYELCVKLSKLQLLSHPFMIPENLTALELTKTVNDICERQKTGKVDFAARKIEGLRALFKQQKQLYKQYRYQLVECSESASPKPDELTLPQAQVHWRELKQQQRRLEYMEHRLASILSQLCDTRQLLQAEMETDRLLEFKAIQLWQRLKQIRLDQGFTSTKIKLVVSHELVDRREDVEIRKQKLREELEDCLEQWKLARRLSDVSKNEVKFDQEACKTAIKKRMNNSYRELGAPELYFAIAQTEPVSEFRHCPTHEQERRKKIAASYYFLQLLYNGKLITQTLPTNLDFATFSLSLRFGSTPLDNYLKLKVSEEPESFHAQVLGAVTNGALEVQELLEDASAHAITAKSSNRAFLCSVFAAIPESSKLESNKDLSIDFIDFSSSDGEVNGQLGILLAWGVDLNGISQGPPVGGARFSGTVAIGNRPLAGQARGGDGVSHFYDPMASFGKTGTLNIRQMLEWLRDASVDPNNPADAGLVQLKQIGIRAQEALSGNAKSDDADYFLNTEDAAFDKVVSLSFSVKNKNSSPSIFRFQIPIRIFNEALGLGPLSQNGEVRCKSRRHLLLKARYDEQVTMRGPIPLNENEIVDTTFERITDTTKPENLEKWLHGGRAPFLGFLKRVRAHAFIVEAKKNRLPQHKDIIREESLQLDPNQESIFAKLFRVRRPLKPSRKVRELYSTDPSLRSPRDDIFKLVIQIGTAFNLPQRKLEQAFSNWDPQHVAMRQRLATTSPFVEVQFMKWRTRTSVQNGSTPVWNETLEINLRDWLGENWTADSLLESSLLTENIRVHLYDQILTNINEDTRLAENHAHYRWEPVWLGSVTIPFSAVYERSKIAGLFHVQVPPIFVGYEGSAASVAPDSFLRTRNISTAVKDANDPDASTRSSPGNATATVSEMEPVDLGAVVVSKYGRHNTATFDKPEDVVVTLDTTRETLIDLFITLEPPLPLSTQVKLPYKPAESVEVLKAAHAWEKARTPKTRLWKALTVSLKGETSFVSSFIESLPLPPDISTVEHAVRFVSLLPCIPRAAVLGGQADIWSHPYQVFEVGAGDYDEHAILLCCYLKTLGRISYVVLGHGIPEGRTAYVALIYDNFVNGTVQVTLINPVTGKFYTPKDAHCPLKEVGCLFDDRNAYGNCQQFSDPTRMNWEVQDTRYWTPVFTKGMEYSKRNGFDAAISPNQSIVYKSLKPDYLKSLERGIEKSIVKAIEDWRPRLPTKWSRIGSRIFHSVVSKLEEFSKNNVEVPAEQLLEVMPEWRSVNTMYRICGFPLNLAYTDIPSVISLVKSTFLYNNENENVEFALAVSAYAYSEKVVSVWLWIATFTKR